MITVEFNYQIYRKFILENRICSKIKNAIRNHYTTIIWEFIGVACATKKITIKSLNDWDNILTNKTTVLTIDNLEF